MGRVRLRIRSKRPRNPVEIDAGLPGSEADAPSGRPGAAGSRADRPRFREIRLASSLARIEIPGTALGLRAVCFGSRAVSLAIRAGRLWSPAPCLGIHAACLEIHAAAAGS